MSKDILLSIIVPVYNASKYLSDCLNSMIDQELDQGEYEIICVDDGSTDNSLEMLNDYSNKYPFIKVFHKENDGVSATRNYAIEKAQGKYLMFVDSDDYICKSSVKPIIDKALKADADIIEWGFRSVWDGYKGQILDNNIEFKKQKINPSRASNVVWKLLIKKSIIDDSAVRFDERIHYGEDSLFSFLIHIYTLNGVMIKTDARVYNYRIVEGSLTHQANPENDDWVQKRINNFFCRIEDCITFKTSNISRKQKKCLERGISRYVSDIVRNTFKIDDDSSDEVMTKLKSMELYPYSIFSCLSEYDSQNNALTFHNKGRFKYLLKHHTKSIIYNIFIIFISNNITYNLVRKIQRKRVIYGRRFD